MPARSPWSSTLRPHEGRAAVLRLAEDCDVFVENFRPGVAKRLGLGPEDFRAVQPDIIYCSISGWGQSGPNSTRGAYDHVIQAATGMMALQGSGPRRRRRSRSAFPSSTSPPASAPPRRSWPRVIRRLRGDTAPITLDVSMVDSALALMSGPAAKTLATGKAPDRVGNRGFVGSPGAETFATSRRPHLGRRQHDGPVRHAVPAARPPGTGEAAASCRPDSPAALSWPIWRPTSCATNSRRLRGRRGGHAGSGAQCRGRAGRACARPR